MDRPTGKAIVLFADGTGNSAAKLFKTNVWRVHQALDLEQDPPAGTARQVAYYHDGVGTSVFKPLALLGGIFGVGLKRNIVEMYRFVCRNYAPGDRIYLFGFSRGAFTVRILASLIANIGILRCATEVELGRYAPDAYRAYRRRFKLPLWGNKATYRPKDLADHIDYDERVGLVDRLRDLRDGVVEAWRSVWGIPHFSKVKWVQIDEIAFMGVWDTVSAYGLPFEELTRAVDDWLWPLSMPNYQLSPKVKCARHALALDEERDSFQPLLWDEVWEGKLIEAGKASKDRLRQVWFAGVHSNVGGGYADDGLSHVPLQWMMEEAAGAGLRFKPSAEWGWTLKADPFGRRYDSRSGIASYYRPQSRRLIAKLDRKEPDPPYPREDTLLLQDPRYTPPGQLTEAKVHHSVITRIKAGIDRYAPTILPPEFVVIQPDGGRTVEKPSALQNGREEWVFDDVWRRRVTYFAIVFASFALAAFPIIQLAWPPSACTGPQCLLAYPIEWVGSVLPGLLGPWIRAFAATPGWFALLLGLILWLSSLSAFYRRRIDDGMRELWAESYDLPLGVDRPATQAATAEGRPSGIVYDLRTHGLYQRTLQHIKWTWVPNVVGAISLVLLVAAGFGLVALTVARVAVASREAYEDDPFVGTAARTDMAHPDNSDVFRTKWPTRDLGYDVEEGRRYRLTLTITERWLDESIRSSPLGNYGPDMPWYFPLAVPIRRSVSEGWYKPVLRIRPEGGRAHLQAPGFAGSCREPNACGDAGQVFTADFKAERGGRLSLFVNDGVIGLHGITGWYYRNNRGAARVLLERVAADGTTARMDRRP